MSLMKRITGLAMAAAFALSVVACQQAPEPVKPTKTPAAKTPAAKTPAPTPTTSVVPTSPTK